MQSLERMDARLTTAPHQLRIARAYAPAEAAARSQVPATSVSRLVGARVEPAAPERLIADATLSKDGFAHQFYTRPGEANVAATDRSLGRRIDLSA